MPLLIYVCVFVGYAAVRCVHVHARAVLFGGVPYKQLVVAFQVCPHGEQFCVSVVCSLLCHLLCCTVVVSMYVILRRFRCAQLTI
jgi:hypothetical protein